MVATTRVRALGILAATLALLLTACSPGPQPRTIGVFQDAPGVGYQDALSGDRSGFDIDLYRWVADNGSERFIPVEVDVSAKDRITLLQKKQVQMVVASFSITDDRSEKIRFAGPYLITQQGVMVRKGEEARIPSITALAGKTACAQTGSTSVRQLQGVGAVVVEEVGLGQCIDRLKKGQVDSVSTDELLLYGYSRRDSSLSVISSLRFGAKEQYGIGLQPEDYDGCVELTDSVQRFLSSGAWDRFFTDEFGDIDRTGYKPSQLNECPQNNPGD